MSNKRKAVEYIAKVTNQLVVKNAAEKALRGERSLDTALAIAREQGNELVVVNEASKALGFEPDGNGGYD